MLHGHVYVYVYICGLGEEADGVITGPCSARERDLRALQMGQKLKRQETWTEPEAQRSPTGWVDNMGLGRGTLLELALFGDRES